MERLHQGDTMKKASDIFDGLPDGSEFTGGAGWKPIDTVPKTGERVIAYERHAGVVVMFWMGGALHEVVSMCRLRTEATHWMELPEPPKETH